MYDIPLIFIVVKCTGSAELLLDHLVLLARNFLIVYPGYMLGIGNFRLDVFICRS